jgi:hypothetical protein
VTVSVKDATTSLMLCVSKEQGTKIVAPTCGVSVPPGPIRPIVVLLFVAL